MAVVAAKRADHSPRLLCPRRRSPLPLALLALSPFLSLLAMSVLLETSLGDLTLDLCTAEAPKAALNFLKLARAKYFNDCCFYDLQKGFTVACGDPSIPAAGQLTTTPTTAGAGASTAVVKRLPVTRGGDSIFGLMYGPQARFFPSEITASLGHARRGTVSLVPVGGRDHANTSAFFITLADDLTYLDGRHAVFAHVVEGLDEFQAKLSGIMTDATTGQPMQNIKIRHTIVLDDPFDDPPALAAIVPPASPTPLLHAFDYEVLQAEEELESERRKHLSAEDLVREEEARQAKSHAVVLEMLGDLPTADLKPPENVLFVCKLNPVTRSDDLELIFSQCGEVRACDVITDWKTGASLQYAFVEFVRKEDAERAYIKMNNVLIDERRIKVDFSQSVSQQWNNFRRDKAKRARPPTGAPTPATTATTAVAPPITARWTPAPALTQGATAGPASTSSAPVSIPLPAAATATSDPPPPPPPRPSSRRSRSRSRSPRRSSRDAPHPSHSRSHRGPSRSRSRDRHHHRASRDTEEKDGGRSSKRRSRSPDKQHRSSSSSHHRDSSRRRPHSRSRSPRRRHHAHRSRSRSHGRR